MALTDIRLQNFRSHLNSAFELSGAVNIVVGPNTSGKTNLLEALLVIATGKSYRAKLPELIYHSKTWSRLDAHSNDGGTRSVKINNQTGRLQKEFDIDGLKYQRLPLAKTLPTVLFEPHHLLLLTGRPDLRRDYIDDLLEQTLTGYGLIRRSYRRALYQRNTLLKQNHRNLSNQLFAWNIKLSQLAGQIAEARHNLVSKLDRLIDQLYKQLSNSRANAKISYQSPIPLETYSSNFLKKLEDASSLDIAKGYTTYGPHRDDLAVTINGHAAQDTASRGEVRTILLALKVLELQILEELRDQKPILLLDDVFSELDGARRRALTSYLKDYQTFITTTDADLVIHNFAQKCHIISLS